MSYKLFKPFFTLLILLCITGLAYAGSEEEQTQEWVTIINHTGHDLRIVEKYISLDDNKIHYYYSDCANDISSTYGDKAGLSIKFDDESNTLGTINVVSADIYEYMSSDGTCSTPSDSEYWPTYYQPEPIVRFQAEDFNSADSSSDRQKIHYTVLENSQDTQAQKAAPVAVVNLGYNSPILLNTIPLSLSTYGNAGALYYIPDVDDSGFLINNAQQVSSPGSIKNPFNDEVYISNTYEWGGQKSSTSTTTLLIK